VPERVWDYPRPPRIDRAGELVIVELGGRVIAETYDALRVLETTHPPSYYLPRSAFAEGVLRPAEDGRSTFCEFKGHASYGDLVGGDGRIARRAAWWYEQPTPAFTDLLDHVALYPGRVDRITVDGEEVVPEAGDFYGGWITSRVTLER
jgi:uncharacterized protein (DUF427 family)